MTKPAYRQRIALSKANLETEIRNAVAKISHRPIVEIVQIVNERCRTSVDPDFIRQLVGR
jgi:hypothetical protein